MRSKYLQSFIVLSLVVTAGLFGCKSAELESVGTPVKTTDTPTQRETQAIPKNTFTAADIAKLKWIEGEWRGMDSDRAFFERYRFEGTTMVEEGFADDTFSNSTDSTRFELKNGEFGASDGDRRSAATTITDDAVQFVPVSGGGNSFRFERQPDGKWRAVLEWPAKNERPAGQKIYQMEPVKVRKKDKGRK